MINQVKVVWYLPSPHKVISRCVKRTIWLLDKTSFQDYSAFKMAPISCKFSVSNFPPPRDSNRNPLSRDILKIKSPRFDRPLPPTLGQNIDRCITRDQTTNLLVLYVTWLHRNPIIQQIWLSNQANTFFFSLGEDWFGAFQISLTKLSFTRFMTPGTKRQAAWR